MRCATPRPCCGAISGTPFAIRSCPSAVCGARVPAAPVRRRVRQHTARRSRGRGTGRRPLHRLPRSRHLVMTAGASAAATAINVCIDMNEGIIARFRTMAITRTSVFTGQVLGSLTRTLISGVLVVAVAIGLGFRPTATPLEWLAVAGVFADADPRPHLAHDRLRPAGQNTGGRQQPVADPAVPALHQQRFRPTASMPAGVRWFAENQPFTPVINTIRGLLTGPRSATHAIVAIAWCVGHHSRRLRVVPCAVQPLREAIVGRRRRKHQRRDAAMSPRTRVTLGSMTP